MASKRKRPHRRKHEGSAADIREDKAQAKKRGMPMKDWENSPADKRMDAAGTGPMPGQTEFNAGDEQAMRQGVRRSRMPEPDMGDLGGM